MCIVDYLREVIPIRAGIVREKVIMGSELDSSFKVFLRFDEIEQKKIDSKMSINSEIDPIFPS